MKNKKHFPRGELLFDAFFLLCLLIISAFLFWKSHFGFANMDECFYLSIPYRLYLGDALFADEWNLAQMSGFILYPFVWLFMKLNGNLDGVILSSRQLYAVCQCALSLFLYFRLKKFSRPGAAVAAICWALYTPFNIMALSYNSMGNMFMLLTLILLVSAENFHELQHFIAGIFFALAVLCQPYLVLLYLIYALFVFGMVLRKKIGKSAAALFNPRLFLFFTSGCATVAAIFFAFVLSRASLQDIVKALPLIMNDPEHPPAHIHNKINILLRSFISYQHSTIVWIYAFLGLLLIICIFGKKTGNRRLIYFIIAAVAVFSLMFYHLSYINTIMYPLNILGLFVYILSEKPIIKKLFLFIWLPGILYAFCVHLASNQEILAFSSGTSVSTVSSILMISIFMSDYAAKIKGQKKLIALAWVITVCIIVLQISSLAYRRYTDIFWDSGIETQNSYIEHGIQTGINVSTEKYDLYYNNLSALAVLDEYHPSKVLYLSPETWKCLSRDYELSNYSAWSSSSVQRYESYYTLNPDKLPDAVFCEPRDLNLATQFCEIFDYTLNSHDQALILTPSAR